MNASKTSRYLTRYLVPGTIIGAYVKLRLPFPDMAVIGLFLVGQLFYFVYRDTIWHLIRSVQARTGTIPQYEYYKANVKASANWQEARQWQEHLLGGVPQGHKEQRERINEWNNAVHAMYMTACLSIIFACIEIYRQSEDAWSVTIFLLGFSAVTLIAGIRKDRHADAMELLLLKEIVGSQKKIGDVRKKTDVTPG